MDVNYFNIIYTPFEIFFATENEQFKHTKFIPLSDFSRIY